MGDRLAGKVAIVTGGARGMGESHVRRFVAEGAKVMFTDVLESEGAALAAEVGPNARFMRQDVSQGAAWDKVVAATEAAFGPVTVLVNNAGIMLSASIEDTTEEGWSRIIAVNQTAVFLGIKAVTPSMRRAGHGSIINISSTNGFVASKWTMAYTATKFAVRGMTKVAAIELGPYNIRVNSVHPGAIVTPLMTGHSKTRLESLAPSWPLPRLGQPHEITNMVLYLASDEASYSTGAEYVVDGGFIVS